MGKKISIAFAGQPNCGKSTVFNGITGARQHVANYPGITVDKKTGEYDIAGRSVFITDLPGTYSLTSYSPEERVSRDFILYEKPELILNIVDGSNLERHLYLTFQLLEMQAKMVMYVNKMDVAEHDGLDIDLERLSERLGIPILAGSAKKKQNLNDLKQLVIDVAEDSSNQDSFQVKYSDDMEVALSKVIESISSLRRISDIAVPIRWLAIKLCEKDTNVLEDQRNHFEDIDSVIPLIEELESKHKESHKHGFDVEIAISRATAAKKIISECVQKKSPDEKKVSAAKLRARVVEVFAACLLTVISFFILSSLLGGLPFDFGQFNIGGASTVDGADEVSAGFTIKMYDVLATLLSVLFVFGAMRVYLKRTDSSISSTDRVDRVLCHRFYGIVILIELILVFYWITVGLGYMLTDKVFPLFRFCRTAISQILPAGGLVDEGLVRGLLLSGVIDGAIMILNYVPIFFFLFALVAFLEDVGYMARLAFIMDRILRKFGLHGQSTLPMILSGVIMGGCVVPGVMSSRTIRDRKSRLVTILILPLLNCMAKIPFYVLVAGIFFADSQWLVLGGISFFTLIMALIVAKYFNLYVVPGEASPFVLELPSYTMPTFRGVLTRTLERLWSFVKKVATTVVAVSIIIWFGITFPLLGSYEYQIYENQKNDRIEKLVKDIKNSYASYFSTEKGIITYNRVEDELSLMDGLTWFGGEASKTKNVNRIMLKNPEYLKVVLRGKIDLGNKLDAFKIYHKGYIEAKSVFMDKYAQASFSEKDKVKRDFYSCWQRVNPYFFAIVRTGTIKIDGDKVIDVEAKKVSKLMRKLNSSMKLIGADYSKASLNHSFLCKAGKFIEPVTKYAGLDWRVNIAILGSFAAKEALVSTLGTIYSVESSDDDNNKVLEERIKAGDTGMTPLDGLVIMLLIALFPPCIATVIVTRTETKSNGWTLFSVVYPVILGSLVAVFVFQFGCLLGF